MRPEAKDILDGREVDEVRLIPRAEIVGWRGGIGCERCRVDLLDCVVARWGGYHFHLCCVSESRRPADPFCRDNGWFGGVAVEFPRAIPPPGMFTVERVLRRYGLDERLLVAAVAGGLFRVVPVHTARPPCPALPLLRAVRPAQMERDIERLRVRLTAHRIAGFDL